MTLVDGPFKGQTAHGIYDLQGETLKICYAVPGAEAPKDFSEKAEGKQLLFVMQRETKGGP
jgi:hypothetical protein